MANDVEKEMSQKIGSLIQVVGSFYNIYRMYHKEIEAKLTELKDKFKKGILGIDGETKIGTLNVDQANELQKFEEGFTSQKQALADAQKADMQALADAQKAEMQALTASQAAEMQRLTAHNEEILARLEEGAEKDELRREQALDQENLRREQALDQENLRRKQHVQKGESSELHAMQDVHLEELQKVQKEHLAEIHFAQLEAAIPSKKGYVDGFELKDVLAGGSYRKPADGDDGAPSPEQPGEYVYSLEQIQRAQNMAQESITHLFNVHVKTFSVELNAKLSEYALREQHLAEEYQFKLQKILERNDLTPERKNAEVLSCFEGYKEKAKIISSQCDAEISALIAQHGANIDGKLDRLRKSEDDLHKRKLEEIQNDPRHHFGIESDAVRASKQKAYDDAIAAENQRHDRVMGKINAIPNMLMQRLNAQKNQASESLAKLLQDAVKQIEQVKDSPYAVIPKGQDAMNPGDAAKPGAKPKSEYYYSHTPGAHPQMQVHQVIH